MTKMEPSRLAPVALVVAFLLQRAVSKCLKHDYEIQEYLTSSKPPWDNYFRISKSVYPSVDLSSSMIFITIKYVSNSTGNVTVVDESKYTWSLSCLYVSGGPISMRAMNVFSLGAIWPNRRDTELSIKLPPLCPSVDEEKTMTYFLSTLQDIADIPARISPSLNTVECVTKGHGKASFSGFKQTLSGVCWSLLIIAIIVGTVSSLVLKAKLKEDCSSNDSCKSEAWSIILLVIFVFVLELFLFIPLFLDFKCGSDYYTLIYCAVVLITLVFECLIWRSEGCKSLVDCKCVNTLFCCTVFSAMFTACHHLLWIFLGLITEPHWAFPVLVATISIFFVLYFIAWEYFKGCLADRNEHDRQAFFLLLLTFLAFALLVFILLAVGQAFFSESLLADAIQAALVALMAAFVKKYVKFGERKRVNKTQT